MKEVDFSKIFIELNGYEIPLERAIQRLRSDIKDIKKIKKFCPKTFVTKHDDIFIGILRLGVYDKASPISIDDICSKIVDNSSCKGIIGRIKQLFRNTYRRTQIEPNDIEMFNALKTNITDSAEVLEPGEDTSCLWNEMIASSFKELVTSQYENICAMTRSGELQVTWLKKFLDQLFTKKGMWPEGMMTVEFLQSKACEVLQLNLDVIDLSVEKSPVEQSSVENSPITQPCGGSQDLERPSKVIKMSDNN